MTRVHFDSFGTDHEPQAFNFFSMELALVGFEVQPFLSQGYWDSFDVVLVLLEVVGMDEYVVQISGCEVVQVWCLRVINEILERCRCVGEPEGHHQRFEQAVPRSERRFHLSPSVIRMRL